MENAVDALKMAAAILIFIIAIGSSFSLFGTAKQTADSIITGRDKQEYLESAELEGVLYSTSDTVKTDGTSFTENGDRIVSVGDIISTISRYSVESYGVTIVKSDGKDGKVLARFSMATEGYVANYSSYNTEWWNKYTELIKTNIKTDYVENLNFGSGIQSLYKVNYYNENSGPGYDAKWLGNSENIQKRVICDLYGGDYETKDKEGRVIQEYVGKNLIEDYLKGKRIVEVTNEIDESKYLKDDGEETGLLQQYNIPTVEIVYIILN